MKILWNRSIGDNKHYRQLTQTMDYTIIEDGADCYPWMETFVIWPRRSVTGQPLFWTKAYKRRVWIMWGTGFHMEPQIEYATAFDLLVYQPKVLGQ